MMDLKPNILAPKFLLGSELNIHLVMLNYCKKREFVMNKVFSFLTVKA